MQKETSKKRAMYQFNQVMRNFTALRMQMEDQRSEQKQNYKK